MNQIKRRKILSVFQKHNPHPVTELIFSNDFELLLSVMLSAQSSDIKVNNTTSKLFKIANTPASILRFGLKNLKNCIRKIGLYNIKSLNIIHTSFLLITKYNGQIPSTRVELETLPGVGRKTANIILNILFKKSTIAVDTHVFRVCNRTNFATGKNVQEVEMKLLKVTPVSFQMNCHAWFVLHGRYICTARQLKCKICMIYSLCEFEKKII